MQYRTLGSTGMQVSVIGLGTWQFGGEWGQDYTQKEVDAIFDEARAQGINLLDTAECYGDHLSEKLCGQAIEKDRDQWIVATKFGHTFHKTFERTDDRTPDDVRKQLEDSLKALRTEVIDLYQYHSFASGEFFDDDVLAVLHKAKDQGKVRHIGNSVRNKADQHEQAAASAQRGIEALQVVYNRLNRMPEENGTLDLCQQQNLGVLARVPLASGYLSGKYQPTSQFQAGDVRAVWHSDEGRRQQIEQAMRIQQEEVPEGVPMAQWALAWCLKHPAVTCVIPGCKRPEQVRNNAAAAELDLAQAQHPQAV
jgi:aryl-alcohol dehydrogenase-like predicted oxidoreductase